MEAQECMVTRRSVRKYNNRHVTEEQVEKILLAAVHAPSGGNAQPWRFAVLRDGVLQDFRERTRNNYFDASCLIAVLVEHGSSTVRWNRLAPVDNPDYASGFAAIQNLLLSAHAMGLGSCWCKPFNPATMTNALRRHFDISENCTLLATVTLGGYEDLPPKPAREPVSKYLLKSKS